jgi:hypothetical protein
MNQLSELEFFPIEVPQDFDVCWAGPNLVDLGGGFCLGSTDGKLLLTDEQGKLSDPIPVTDSQEAINGVARTGDWLGVSTREDVTFHPLLGEGYATAPYGAHGISTTADGYFIAPLGLNGIMAAPTPVDRDARLKAYSAEEAGLYVYRLTILGSQIGAQVIACAARSGGIVAGQFAAGQQTMGLKVATQPAFDVVDICPLEPGTSSRAVAALGRDGRMFFFHDVLDDKKPTVMKFQSVQGIAYRILASHGDIHLLTSKGLFVLGELASRFLRKELTGEVNTPVRMSLLEVIDANLVDNRWLVVVVPGMVAKYNLEKIHRQLLDHLDDAEIQEDHTADGMAQWEWRDVPTTTKPVTLAG